MTRSPPLHHLSAGQTQTLHPRPGAVLRVQGGQLWITQTGNAEDHFIRAGGILPLTRGRVVVQAEGGQPARYTCAVPHAGEPTPACWPRPAGVPATA